MKYLKATLLGSGALASLLLSSVLTSCQDEDFGYTSEEIRAAAYARNFENKYGKISKNQTWDFSSYGLYNMGLSGGATVDAETRSFNSTRANSEISHNLYGDYEISSTTTKWLNEHMAEKVNNSSQVMSFSLKASDVFYILPIYQGQSGMLWDLKLEDESNSYTIWHKSDGFKFTTDFTMWEEFHYQTGSHTANWDNNANSALRLANIFSNLSSSIASSGDVKLTFSVPNGLSSLKGHFIIQYEYTDSEGEKKPGYYNLTGNDFNISTNEVNKANCADNGYFTFSSANNSTIANGHLEYNGGYGNQVDLKPIIGKTFTGNNNTEVKLKENLSNLIFTIDKDTYDSNYTFYTWSGKRIRVFAKYNYVGSEENMTHRKADAYMKAHTISKNHLKTQLIKIDHDKINGVFNFNLETTDLSDGDKGLSTIGEAHRSNDIPGMMRAITTFSSGNVIEKDALREKLNFIIGYNGGDYNELPADFKYMVLGCEDARGGGLNSDGEVATTDWDYNDIVFLIVGRELPMIYEGTVEKRYMIEDLGSTFDFDFNDIVVDVKEEHTRDLSDPYKYNFKQTAKIQFLCGTIPFQIYLGEKPFGTKPMLGHNGADEQGFTPNRTEYSWEFIQNNIEISDVTKDIIEESYASVRRTNKIWDPLSNNIKVLVWPKAETDGKGNEIYWNGSGTSADNINSGDPVNIDDIPIEHNTVLFPKEGEYPYIIATDPTVTWMPELHSIPEYWLQTKPLTAWGVTYDGPSGWSDPDKQSINVNLGQAILPSFTYPLTGWDYKAYISNTQFSTANIAVGDKIVLTISDVITTSSPSLTLTVPSGDWSYKIGKDPSKDNDNGYFGLTENQTSLVIEIKDSDDITKVKESGIAIQGHAFTLRQVDVVKPAVVNTVLSVDVPSALGAKYNYSVTAKNNDSGINFQRIYLTGAISNYNGYDDILVTVANPSSEKDITAQVIAANSNLSGNKTITSGNYVTYELKADGFKSAYNNGTLYLETYDGSDLFTRTDGQKAQIYVTTRTVVKDVNVPDELGEEFEYYHTPAHSTGNDSDYPRVYLGESLDNYNGFDDIWVTIANRSNTSLTAKVATYGNNTDNQSVASGEYYTFKLTADAYKQAMESDNPFIYLEVNQGGDKLNRSVADAAKIYVTAVTADEANVSSQKVFGTDNYWQATSNQNGNYGVMFSNGRKLNVDPSQYNLRVYYTTDYDSEFYGICQSNGGDWWKNPIANGSNKGSDSNGDKYIQLVLTETIVNDINNQNRPLYINTANSEANGHLDTAVTKVTLVKK